MRLFRAFQLFNAHVIYLHDWPRRLPRKQTTESARREQEIWKAQIFLTLCKRTVTVNSRTLIALSRRETFPPLEQTIDVQFGLDWLVGGSANVCLLQEGKYWSRSIQMKRLEWKTWTTNFWSFQLDLYMTNSLRSWDRILDSIRGGNHRTLGGEINAII